jgi:hypothetical protein
MSYDPSSDPTSNDPTSTQEGGSFGRSRVLVTFEIGSIADAQFLKDQPHPTFDVPKRVFTSSQAEDLLQLIGLVLHDCKIPGAETAVQRLRFVEDGELGTRRQLVLIAPALDGSVEHAASEDQISKAIAPLIAHLVEDGALFKTSGRNEYEEYPDAIKDQVRAFQQRYSRKKAAQPVEITVGSTKCASITGGVWRSCESVDVPDEHYVAFAVCNGWKCDERIVFLKDVNEHMGTKNKYEAFFDQRLHQDVIRDAAGRPARVLKLNLRKETTPKKVLLHVQHVEIAPSGEQAFVLHAQ